MIAKNYIRFPEALRFQIEMFSNGYKNSPRIMRLMTVIFKQVQDVPAWVKKAAAAAKRLVKMWKSQQVEINFKSPVAAEKMRVGFYYGPAGETWSGRGLMPRWLSTLVKQGNNKVAYQYDPLGWAT